MYVYPLFHSRSLSVWTHEQTDDLLVVPNPLYSCVTQKCSQFDQNDVCIDTIRQYTDHQKAKCVFD